MTEPLSFQKMILTLHQYWSDRGCLILQPYDMEMGAGTFHTATTLRALGPDPWNAAFVQPCRRPTDGRYGDNPNRLQRYYQYQVAMKPAPDNIQQLYLDSLKALGIDPLADPTRLTLTGGLPFFGGAGNNYSMHAIAAMVGSFAISRMAATSRCHGSLMSVES